MIVSIRRGVATPFAVALAMLAAAPIAHAGVTFHASVISSPTTGAELFYDGVAQAGTVTVQGSVTPAITTTGTLVCYSAPATYTLAAGVPITVGAFSATVSLAPVAGQVCRLELVPSGPQLITDVSAPTNYAGPVISVSTQVPLSSNGLEFGYYVLAGDPSWSFAFGGDVLGTCPIAASDATDPSNYGSYSLFFGNACLPAVSGLPPNQATRSAIQISGLNAYLPGSVPWLTARAGFQPMSVGTAWDPTHDTVTISETDALMVCTTPGGYPPIASDCPSLAPAGVQLQQTTTVESGDQVARVSQTFNDTDGTAHTLDLLFSQAVHAYETGGAPGFEFPAQGQFATHGAPDAYSPFPAGPGTIDVVADASDPPSGSNPIGAITYSTPPQSATFVNARTAQTASFLMHYVESIPAGGSVNLEWSFSQAASAASLGPLVQLEIDRFYSPTVAVATPAQGATVRTASVLVSGQASDPGGISAVSVDGQSVTAGPAGTFTTTVPLHLGANTIQITATNLAGVTGSAERVVVYTPVPCLVPKLTGRTLARARKMLSGGGCIPGRVVKVHSRRVKRGKVVSTTPRAGTRRSHGTRIRITLSAGAPRAKRRSHHRRPPSTRSHRGRSARA
jgi:hypothetical protein